MSVPFVHLHTHTSYSCPNGVMRIDHMLARARELGQTAMAITDSGVMSGVFEFYQAARVMEIKPLIGMEAIIAQEDSENTTYGDPDKCHHITLIAKNIMGYLNLCRLSTEGFLSRRKVRPSISSEDLERWADGVIALSGCEKSEIARLLLAGKKEQAESVANRYQEVYGQGNFYLEINPGKPGDTSNLPAATRELSVATGIPLVATANAHYVYPGQEAVQNLLRHIHGDNGEHAEAGKYLRSAEEMLAALPECEDALENTVRIAEMCSLELLPNNGLFPSAVVPANESPNEYLSRLCMEGLEKRYGPSVPPNALGCLMQELSNIEKKGLAQCFLAFRSMTDLARRKGVLVGAGNGTIAGSIVAYLLGITAIDPLAHGLYPERFLNNEPVPEIGLSLERGGKQVVLDNLGDIFDNHLHTAIASYGRFTLRSGLADAGRILGAPQERIDSLVQMIPDAFIIRAKDTSLQAALRTYPSLRGEYASSPTARRLLDAAGSLEGVIRLSGITRHFVMVTDKAAADAIPLMLLHDDVTTQYDANTLRKLGVNRLYIFESDALAIIRKTIGAVRISRGVLLDAQDIPLDDQAAYVMLSRGDSDGVVHLESPGFRRFLTRFRPESFSDLVAMIAVYRPSGLNILDGFVARKHSPRPITYPHPVMEQFLGETYGMILYYEQIIALVDSLAYFGPDIGERMCREAVKGNTDMVAAYHEKFINQIMDGIDVGDASRIFNHIVASAGHCYSKAHSVCAARLAFQCAYLKCHYPEEYLDSLVGVGYI